MSSSAFEVGVEHQRAGRLREAVLAYRQVLAREPDHPNAAFLLGGILLAHGHVEAALALLERAVELDASNAAFHANLAEAQRRLGRLEAALQSFARALQLQPHLLPASANLGLLMEAAEALPDARSGAPDALALRARLLLARVYATRGDAERAISLYRRAVADSPRHVAALLELGALLEPLGRTDDASTCFQQALEVEPDNLELLTRLASVLQISGRLEEAVPLLRRCLEIQNFPQAHSLLLLSLPYLQHQDDAAILKEARAWEREHAAGLGPGTNTFSNDRTPQRRLRIGYVSPYFREHAHEFFLDPVFVQRDREAFEVWTYADVPVPDAETENYRRLSDVWRETTGWSDERLAQVIREDGIDILVDLTMHAQNNRLLAFARKPAPVQLCWLAYPGTTGLSAMDYRVTDPYLDPPGTDPALYAETSLTLPDSFWCYSPRTLGPEVSPLPASSNGYVTFGCLNNFVKVNREVLQVWAQVLCAVADSRLMLLAPPGDARARTLRVLGEHGVDAARVSFVDRLPREEYLSTYRSIDVCLDTFPCCGHTTSLDALWMGVPMITLAGDRVIGRAGVSIAMNLGLPELIAESHADYVHIAVELCTNLERLSALRFGLRARMQASPLMDGARFARNLEALYRQAWQAWITRPSAAGA